MPPEDDEPLPPYTYVPGRAPHPVRDPGGHLHGRTLPAPLPFDPDRWWECREFVRGVELFNAGYYWEAHEVWEALWHAAGRSGPTAGFLQGLIKLAAAGVKAYEGRAEGVRRHARRSGELLRAAADRLPTPWPASLHLAEAQALADHVQEAAADLAGTQSTPPVSGLLGIYRPRE